MARASAAPAPPPEPFWELPAFRWGLVLMCGALLLTGGIWLERTNRSYQLERRLQEDPRLGPMTRKLKAQIAEAEHSGILKDPAAAARGQVPQALWLGRVSEVRENETRDAGILELTGAQLLAGRPGPHDRSGVVRAGRRRFLFDNRPREGETWLVSVWRDGADNVIHSAARYAPAPKAP